MRQVHTRTHMHACTHAHNHTLAHMHACSHAQTHAVGFGSWEKLVPVEEGDLSDSQAASVSESPATSVPASSVRTSVDYTPTPSELLPDGAGPPCSSQQHEPTPAVGTSNAPDAGATAPSAIEPHAASSSSNNNSHGGGFHGRTAARSQNGDATHDTCSPAAEAGRDGLAGNAAAASGVATDPVPPSHAAAACVQPDGLFSANGPVVDARAGAEKGGPSHSQQASEAASGGVSIPGSSQQHARFTEVGSPGISIVSCTMVF